MSHNEVERGYRMALGESLARCLAWQVDPLHCVVECSGSPSDTLPGSLVRLPRDSVFAIVLFVTDWRYFPFF